MTESGRPRRRTTRQVFEDHLRRRRRGEVEKDTAANYAEGAALLTGDGAFRGHEGARRCAALLRDRLPCARYAYRVRLVEGEAAFLEWSARCAAAEVEDGADSFLVRGGLIVAQTIHYTVRPRAAGGTATGQGARQRPPGRRRER
jgi:hypothetical protein